MLQLFFQVEAGVGSWQWHKGRSSYYGTINDEPLLNLCSEAVSAMFSDVQSTWLKRGVAGVVLNPDFGVDDDCGAQLVKKMIVAGMGCARNSNMDAP